MPKVEYMGAVYDSQLEVDYLKHIVDLHLSGDVISWIYHPIAIQLTNKNKYTPDFVVVYADHIEIIETKGYNQYSVARDTMTHNMMLAKSELELQHWLQYENGIQIKGRHVVYRKIKKLSKYGFVDWDFKNPDTLSNKRAKARDEAISSLKQANQELKDYKRYFKYKESTKKLSKSQTEWLAAFIKEHEDDRNTSIS